MTDLDAVEDLVHELDARVLEFHLCHLQLFVVLSDDGVDGDEQDHDGDAGEHRRAERLPQEVQANDHLKYRYTII